MKWEYLVETVTVERHHLQESLAGRLNRYGDDGWELVSITHLVDRGPVASWSVVFKRRVGA